MKAKDAILEIKCESVRASVEYPDWPMDPVHAAAIVAEEAGELVQAANDFYWGHKPSDLKRLEKEAIQTGAMAIRFLEGLEAYTRIEE